MNPLTDIYEAIVSSLQNFDQRLKWIDIDLGQIDKDAVNVPIQFPAVLIKFEDVIWRDKTNEYQEGIVNISIKTVFKFMNEADNFIAIKIREEVIQYLELLTDIHTAMTGISGQTYSKFVRYNQYQLKTKPEYFHWIQVMEYQCLIQSNGNLDDPNNVTIDYNLIRDNNDYMERKKYNLIHR